MRTRRDITPLRDLQARAGHIDAQSAADALGVQVQSARQYLGDWARAGTLRRVARGKYVVADDQPAPASAATAPSDDDMIGIPLLGDHDPELVKLALVALLEAGRHLAALLPDNDVQQSDAVQEYVAGALRDQSRHAAMLRLMLEVSGAT